MEVQDEKLNSKDQLYMQYNWFNQSFLHSIQLASNEFFSELFDFKLISISKNINILFQGNDYFVTKIRIDKQHDVFFRYSEDAVKIVLDEILGEARKFSISNITELEAKIISSFNDYSYNNILRFLLPPTPQTKKRKNFDTIHLTFFIKPKQSSNGAKVILSLPQILLAPQAVQVHNEKFDISSFRTSKIDVNIKVGKTKFLVKELKNLEKEDIVVFEDSDIHSMRLIYKDYEKDFKVTPNPGLVTSINNDNGGHNMDKNTSQNLWDEIQVEMGAEFEKVKITLGELKNIEEGLVLDLSSVYDNKITLKVENKTIATGELIIINDRYGVKIDKVFASEHNPAAAQHPEPQHTEGLEETESQVYHEQAAENSDEEFDYSDFELDEQDI